MGDVVVTMDQILFVMTLHLLDAIAILGEDRMSMASTSNACYLFDQLGPIVVLKVSC